MDKSGDLENHIELDIVKAPLDEKEALDRKNGSEESKAQLEKEAKAQVAFV